MYIQHSINGQIIGAVVGAWTVAILALKYGRPDWTLLDKLCLAGAVLAVTLWQTLDNATLGMMTSLGGIFLASISTFERAWHNPKGEDRTAWSIYWLSCLIALCAIPQWDLEHAGQPVTFAIIETTMMCLLFIPRKSRRE